MTAALIEPQPGRIEGNTIPVSGWATVERGVMSIQVVGGGRVLNETAPTASSDGGFQMLVGTLGLPSAFGLSVRATFQGGAAVPIATITAVRGPLETGFQPSLSPIVVTSLGRTGTTWLMRMLAAHPEIVVYDRFPYETNMARYWLHLLKVASNPAHAVSIAQDNFHAVWNTAVNNPYYRYEVTRNLEAAAFMGDRAVRELARAVQAMTAGWYETVGSDRPDARFFAEKQLPGHVPLLMWELYPGTREIVLVRDFRDMLCSIIAFNKKRGFRGVGPAANSADEYVSWVKQAGLSLLGTWRTRSDRAHLLRYEDLVARPAETLGEALSYLGVSGDDATVGRLLERGAELDAQLESHRTTADLAASVGRWRQEANGDMRALFSPAFDEILDAFGYEPTA